LRDLSLPALTAVPAAAPFDWGNIGSQNFVNDRTNVDHGFRNNRADASVGFCLKKS